MLDRLNRTAAPIPTVAFDCDRRLGFPRLIPLFKKPYLGGGTLPAPAVGGIGEWSLPFVRPAGVEFALADAAGLGGRNLTLRVAKFTAGIVWRVAKLTAGSGRQSLPYLVSAQ